MVDIVIPLSAESASNNLELRLALRSIERYAKNVGLIWIYTPAKLDWIQNVHVVPFDDPIKDNKDANLFNKIKAAANNPDINENFMFWSDDQALTGELDLEKAPVVANMRSYQVMKQLCDEPKTIDLMEARDAVIDRPKATVETKKTKIINKWQLRMKHTMEYVQSVTGREMQYNFDSHTPQPYTKTKVREIFAELPYTEQPGLCINTAYYGVQGVPYGALQSEMKHTFEGGNLNIPISMKTYIGYDTQTWNKGLVYFLLGYFYNACKYEKVIG